MIRVGREVRSRTDYILGTDFRLFWNVSVQDPRHNSDHYMVLGCLYSAPMREHSSYLEGRKRPPLRPPTAPTREDGNLCGPTEGRPEASGTGCKKNRVDLGGHMETR